MSRLPYFQGIAGDVLAAVHDQYISLETVNEGLQCLCTYLGSPRFLSPFLNGCRGVHCQS